MWIYFTPLNCTLKNGHDGKPYVRCILPRKKKILKNLQKEPQLSLELRPTELFSGICIFYHYVMNNKYTLTLFNTAVHGDNKKTDTLQLILLLF